MQKRKKAVIVALSCLIMACCALLLASKLVLILQFDDKKLKEHLQVYFKNKISKAIKYENASLSVLGNVVIRDFFISNSSDFNDNVNLVHSKKAVIRLKLIPLLAGSVEVSGADFYDSDITIIKKYENGYIETFSGLFKTDLLSRSGSGAVQLRFYNSRARYKEFMQNAPVLAEMSDFYINFVRDDEELSFILKGSLDALPESGQKHGHFDARGSVKYGKVVHFVSRVVFDGLDMSYFSPYVRERLQLPYSLKGTGSADIRIARRGEALSVSGTVKTKGFGVYDLEKKYNIFTGEEASGDFDIHYDPSRGSWRWKRINFRDREAHLETSGEYVCNRKRHAFSAKLKTGEIDLADLSDAFTPLKGCRFRGKLSLAGDISLDLKKNTCGTSWLELDLRGFDLLDAASSKKLIAGGYLWVKMKGDRVMLSMHAKADRSDLTARAAGSLISLSPVKTNFSAVIDSDSFQPHYAWRFLTDVVERLYVSGLEDRKKGYDEVLFLQRPASVYLNGNDVSLSWRARTLLFGKNARLRNFRLDLSLQKGQFALGDFSLAGYDGAYSLAMNAVFNTDHPFMSMRGGIDNLDAGAFFRDFGMRSLKGGKMKLEFDFALGGYRLGHFVDNSLSNFTLTLSDGIVDGHPLQSEFDSFMKKNGIAAPSCGPFAYSTMSYSINQNGENFLFKGLQISSDRLSFNAWGPYSYADGIKMPVTITVRDKERAVNAQVLVTGPLMSPCLTVPAAKNPSEWCLFRTQAQ